MKALKIKKLIATIFVAVVFFSTIQTSLFSENNCDMCKVTCFCTEYELSEPIIGDILQIVGYELELIPGGQGEPITTSLERSILKVKIPVDLDNEEVISGIQVDLSKMKNVVISVRDGRKLLDRIYIEENNIDGLWSVPVYGNKVTLRVESSWNWARSNNVNEPYVEIGKIKYNKKKQIDKTVDYFISSKVAPIPALMNAEYIKSFIDKIYGINSSDIKVDSDILDEYTNSNASVVYDVRHGGSLDGLNMLRFGEDLINIDDMKNNSDYKNWIIQRSCLVLNTTAAGSWCDYLTSNNNNTIKGIFGYSEVMKVYVGSAHRYTRHFVELSQNKPMLDSYLGSHAQLAMDIVKSSKRINNSVHWANRHAYATVIINESNLTDSMFTVTENSSDTYRFYRLKIKNPDAQLDVVLAEIEMQGKYFVAEYGQLVKQNGEYDFVRDSSGEIIWNQEVLTDYEIFNPGRSRN
ncbi:UNVERIFIED_CONTAM: hypothetical protein Cloal_0182 [Acetivibrio alkalicellulosi]